MASPPAAQGAPLGNPGVPLARASDMTPREGQSGDARGVTPLPAGGEITRPIRRRRLNQDVLPPLAVLTGGFASGGPRRALGEPGRAFGKSIGHDAPLGAEWGCKGGDPLVRRRRNHPTYPPQADSSRLNRGLNRVRFYLLPAGRIPGGSGVWFARR
jgi:hypothetical protein